MASPRKQNDGKQMTGQSCALSIMLFVMGLVSGCFHRHSAGPVHDVPRELEKISLPAYRIEMPDILLIDILKITPKQPYDIELMDLVRVTVAGTPDDQKINGTFRVESSGNIILGPTYGRVHVLGLSLEEAEKKVLDHLAEILVAPEVSLSLEEPAARQELEGEHLVAVDGTVNLGVYGTVRVVGLTVEQARAVVEKHLEEYLQDPQISIDLRSYSSKAYYVILQGAGDGDQITRLAITGNETVLDAVSQVGGFTNSQTKCMWIARPSPGGCGEDQMLLIDWTAITQGASTATNYQIMPNDRLFISNSRLVQLNNFIQDATSPFERLFGQILIGTQLIQTTNRGPSGFQGTPGNNRAAGT